ncbi:unnamed protein product [Allacma fusca]|uniref:Uncharacterized protein n=1 Tax=Allacma fusca TaxID=39272 RepID=A0A8J2LH67_9HEXA|nr:unnamed protein product [Allacma fusca]
MSTQLKFLPQIYIESRKIFNEMGTDSFSTQANLSFGKVLVGDARCQKFPLGFPFGQEQPQVLNDITAYRL